MSAINHLSAAEVDVTFLDWGVTATLESVTEVYDPQTGLRAESVIRHTVTVINNFAEHSSPGITAAEHVGESRSFLIRRADLPVNFLPAGHRLTVEQRTYRIRSLVDNAAQGICLLNCLPI